MSNTYVKKYDVGQVKVDLPSATHIHELPLLSFGDVLHTINLSLVYNHKMYRDGINTSFIAPGFRINLQKQINFENNIPKFLQDENGQCVPLTYWNGGALYTFEDNSKRILRRLGSTYELENPDRSKEYYSEAGRITSIVDKYGETILLYTYNGSNQLVSITYRDTKTIEFAYLSDKLCSITYASKTTTIGYDDTRLTVAHYSDVDYNFSTSYNNFVVYSTDAGEEYSDTCSRKYICSGNDNTLVVSKVVCGTNVDTTTYNFEDYSAETEECNFVDVTDKFGVTSRIQLENRKPAYSYELTNNFFDGEEMGDPIYTGTVFSYNSKDVMGTQSESAGLKLEKITDNHWCFNNTSTGRISGQCILSGWINVVGNNNCTFTIRKPEIPEQEYCVTHSVPVIKDQTWQYFAFSFNVNNMNDLTITTNIAFPSIYSKDLRLTFQSGTILSYKSLLCNKDVFVQENANGEDVKIFTADKCEFYIGNTLLNQKITSSDVLKYKINQAYGSHSNEIYYDDCKGVTVNTNLFNLKYVEDETTYTVPVTDLAVGKIIYQNSKTFMIKTNFYAEEDSVRLITKSYVNNVLYKEDVYDEHLNLIRSTVDGVTTTNIRNSKGLVTSQKITAVGTTEEIVTSASYDDNCTKIISTTDEFGVTTTYQTDDVWGLIHQVFVDENNVISNEYDMNKLALTKKLFSNDTNDRTNSFGYANGNLETLATGNLKYKMSYSNGYLNEVSKLDATTNDETNEVFNSIEYHTYTETEGETTVKTIVTSKYPSAESALRTEIKRFDKYDRLIGIDGVLINTFDISPTYDEEDGYAINGRDNASGKLATTQDLTRGETLKYAYEDNRLSRVATVDITGIIKEETFEYDEANRVTKDRLEYDENNSRVYESIIEYEKDETDPTADNRINRYSCYLDGETSPTAQSGYDFDSFNRVKSKFCSIEGKEFVEHISYDKTRPTRLVDMVDGRPLRTTDYTYDVMGRIASVSSGGYTTSYSYDKYGQLIREDNQGLDKTFQYEYNNDNNPDIGNVWSVKTYSYTPAGTEPSGTPTTTSFNYSNTTHPDRLTSYNGKTITYNANGGVASYDGWNYSWSNGKLSGISKTSIGSIARAPAKPITTSTKNYTFTYNALGQRTNSQYSHTWTASGLSPIQPGDVTAYNKNYIYDSTGRLIEEVINGERYVTGSFTNKLRYLYDANGMVGVEYTNGANTDAYYYLRNLLGDVVAIYDSNGAKVVEYAYDAWGNCTVKGTTSNYNLAYDNPIRYRGYYYDADTNLYYLNARYYSPEFRRFISPDDTYYLDPESVNGLNLYCYCNNDPVNYCDPSGHSSVLAVVLCAIAVVGLGLTVGGVATDNDLMTAIGLTMVAIPALISGGLAIWGTTGALSTVIGIGTMAAGGFTGVFAGAEYQEAFTGQNFILDSGIISENYYNSLMLTTAGIATFGTITSSTVYSLQINKILEAGKIRGVKATKGYPGVRFVDNFNNIRSLEFHTPHDTHGIHLQLNNWWLNHPQHTGKYYRGFAKHFEIFKFWKGWF